MQKYIIILCFLSILFVGCGSDSPISLKTLSVDNQEYKMPLVTDDVSELRTYLKRMTSNVQESKQDNTIVISATFNAQESKLFKSITYTIVKDNNNEFSNLEFSYKFRNFESFSSEVRKSVVQYIANSTAIKI